jgi:hypothetical protein
MCFGTMFPKLSPFHYSDQAAADLAATMENHAPDAPGIVRGTADDSATLPAEYTYLGQFIDHNLDFDQTIQPTGNVNASSLTNFESFRFDLNNVFAADPRWTRSCTRATTSTCWYRGRSEHPGRTGSPPSPGTTASSISRATR